MSQGEMTIGVGIRTELSTDARVRYDSPPPLSSVAQIAGCAVGSFPLQSDQNMWKLTCLVTTKAETIMTDETILYISDQTANNDSVLAALKATGYEVVSTNSSTQAIALLFLLHSVAGVVLNHQARERAKFDIARSLRAIRSDIPIVLLCRGQVDCPPSWVDACISTGQSLEKVAAAVRRLLVAKRFQLLIAQL